MLNGSGEKHVVIIGGGFAGLTCARRLAQLTHRHRDIKLRITIVDRHNYHLFQPLLYQVAMAGLSPGEIAMPIRTVLSRFRNVQSLLGRVQEIDLRRKIVRTEFTDLTYDYLVLACGAQHSYFGHEEWEPFAPGLKTLEQATEVRRRVLLAFELAERETNPQKIRQLLTFVVVGAGATGVELAGSLGEISRFTLSRDFRTIDPRQTRIILIEAGPRILANFDASLSQQAQRDLEELGVTVWTNTRVTQISPEGVRLGNETVESKTVLWAAGVMPSDLNAKLGLELDRQGRIIVEPDLSVAGYREVFILGDQAHFAHTDDHQPLPGLAPVAMQQGRRAAENVFADLANRQRQHFVYNDKGQMATIGRRRAIAQMGRLRFSGILAWYAWLLVHIFYLIGFRNRILVLIQWAWSYFTFRRGAQLILNRDWRSFTSTGEAVDSKAIQELSQPR